MSNEISPNMLKAARCLIGWTQSELARHTDVGVATIRNFESGSSFPRASTMRNIVRSLEDNGVTFTVEGGVISVSIDTSTSTN